ncbi:unnamed protein product [Arctogadus glacialis]
MLLPLSGSHASLTALLQALPPPCLPLAPSALYYTAMSDSPVAPRLPADAGRLDRRALPLRLAEVSSRLAPDEPSIRSVAQEEASSACCLDALSRASAVEVEVSWEEEAEASGYVGVSRSGRRKDNDATWRRRELGVTRAVGRWPKLERRLGRVGMTRKTQSTAVCTVSTAGSSRRKLRRQPTCKRGIEIVQRPRRSLS